MWVLALEAGLNTLALATSNPAASKAARQAGSSRIA